MKFSSTLTGHRYYSEFNTAHITRRLLFWYSELGLTTTDVFSSKDMYNSGFNKHIGVFFHIKKESSGFSTKENHQDCDKRILVLNRFKVNKGRLKQKPTVWLEKDTYFYETDIKMNSCLHLCCPFQHWTLYDRLCINRNIYFNQSWKQLIRSTVFFKVKEKIEIF